MILYVRNDLRGKSLLVVRQGSLRMRVSVVEEVVVRVEAIPPFIAGYRVTFETRHYRCVSLLLLQDS
jgi:hypothetical protein